MYIYIYIWGTRLARVGGVALAEAAVVVDVEEDTPDGGLQPSLEKSTGPVKIDFQANFGHVPCLCGWSRSRGSRRRSRRRRGAVSGRRPPGRQRHPRSRACCTFSRGLGQTFRGSLRARARGCVLSPALGTYQAPKTSEKELFIDNLLARVHLIIVMIRWTGLAPWELEFAIDLEKSSPSSGCAKRSESPVPGVPMNSKHSGRLRKAAPLLTASPQS